MIRILELLIAMAVVVVIFVVVGLCLPSHRHVSFPTETNRPLPVVFDMLSGFKRFKDWSPLRSLDPKTSYNLSGPENGKGAHVDYASDSKLVGTGSWQVTGTEGNEKIVFDVNNDDYGSNKTMTIRLKRVGNQKRSVEITESYDVDYGFNLFGRYSGLYVSRSVGDPMKSGLTSLNNLLATVPKYDYTELPVAPKIVPVPAENLLVAPTDSKRADNDIATAMETQEKWLRQVITKNGLEATGPLRITTIDFGAENYKFEVSLPVKKAGQAPGEALPTLDVKMVGDEAKYVQYRQTKPTSAITTTYAGHMAQLAANREMLKAWAATHGVSVGDHPYETYAKGVPASFTAEGDFTMFWPLKQPGSK